MIRFYCYSAFSDWGCIKFFFRNPVAKIFYPIAASSSFPGKSLLLCCFLLHTFLVQSQVFTYSFDKLTIEDGLSQNFIYCTEQDHRGFLWFGTKDGLNRYDGYEFKVYNHVPADSNSLNDNTVTALFEDSRQNLWVGAGGLLRYDRLNDRMEEILGAATVDTKRSSINILKMQEDHNGHLWVAIQDVGIYRLEFQQVALDTVPKPDFKLFGPYDISGKGDFNHIFYEINQISTLDDELWISSVAGLFKLKANDQGFFPDPDSAEFQAINFNVGEGKIEFASLFEDADGGLWINSDQGMIKLNHSENLNDYQFYPFPPGLFTHNWQGKSRKIIQLNQELWMGTYFGLLIFDMQNHSFQLLKNNPENERSLSADNIPDLLEDNSGNVWIGTAGLGINKFTGIHNKFHHYLDKNLNKELFSVYNLAIDTAQKVWFKNSIGNLYYLDQTTQKASLLEKAENEDWVVSNIIADAKGFLWLIMKNKLIKFNPYNFETNEYSFIKPGYSVDSDSLPVLHIDQQGTLWACNTGKLSRFDSETKTFEFFPLPDNNLEQIGALYRDEQGIFWIGSHQGLLRLDITGETSRLFKSNPQFKDSLNHKQVNSILPDPEFPEKFLWLGTAGGGLNKFNKQDETFQAFTKKDGLPNEYIYGVLSDEKNNLWMSTNHGLTRFNTTTRKFTNFVYEDGLQSNEFNTWSYLKGRDGKMFFGGINGITAFYPDQIVPNMHKAPVVFTEMLLAYEPIPFGRKNDPLKHTITEAKNVYLSHDQNNISIQFAGLDYTSPEKNKYLYRLEGFDQTWIEAGKERRASYTNLQPDAYVFRVKAANSDGIWNDKTSSLRILITPPVWKTWWAYLGYTIATFLIFFFLHRYKNERKKMQEEIKLKKLENEKLAALDQFKSRFFANVSHEFRTPVTIIQGQADALLEQFDAPDTQAKLRSIKKSGFQVLRLIEQLLDITQLEDSQLSLKQSAGDLKQFLEMLVGMLQSSACHKEVALNFYSTKSSLSSFYDWDVLQKIFLNLISNAIKFTPPGGKIYIKLEKQDEYEAGLAGSGKSYAKISVEDTGVGIAPTEIGRIFDRFYQSETSTTLSLQGFGLGLSLVKELVQLCNGRIEVSSVINQGTTFCIWLPLQMQLPEAGDVKQKITINSQLLNQILVDFSNPEEVATEADVAKNVEKMGTLLIIEDYDDLRTHISKLLTPQFEVLEATNGEEGLAMARQTIPDLIISDVMMPQMDGYTFCREIKNDERTSHIPVILLTAKAEMADKLKGLELGADDYLVKPFNAEELKSRIFNLIKSREILMVKYAKSLFEEEETVEDIPLIEEVFLKKVKVLIKENFSNDQFGVEKLSKEVGMSTSQLYRKIKGLTGLSTLQLLNQFRLEKAIEFLHEGYNVSEVTFMVGFTSPSYFSQLFKKYYGYSPKEQKDINHT